MSSSVFSIKLRAEFNPTELGFERSTLGGILTEDKVTDKSYFEGAGEDKLRCYLLEFK